MILMQRWWLCLWLIDVFVLFLTYTYPHPPPVNVSGVCGTNTVHNLTVVNIQCPLSACRFWSERRRNGDSGERERGGRRKWEEKKGSQSTVTSTFPSLGLLDELCHCASIESNHCAIGLHTFSQHITYKQTIVPECSLSLYRGSPFALGF